jgi:hypothetical protein
VLEFYDELTHEFELRTIDATGEIPEQQRMFRQIVQDVVLHDYDRERAKGNHVRTQPR